jgi:hypothetical protein
VTDRALAPVVGKALEAGIVVLYVGLLVAALYGNAVPGYRTAAGEEVGERVLATAAERVQQAVPPAARAVDARYRVDLPRTIRGRGYRIRAAGRALVLDHPHPAIGDEAALALPPRVVRVEGTWSSREPAVVRVTDAAGGLVVRLDAGAAP